MSEYPPPNYEQSPVTETNIWAVISLISGILGWLGVVGIGGLAAVVAGHVAKSQIRASGGRMGGDGMATAGLILGYLNLALTVAGICLFILITVGAISGAAICPFVFGNN
jgi:hypothetical protein